MPDNRTQLDSVIDTLYPDNSSQNITPEDLRNGLKALVASLYNIEDDDPTTDGLPYNYQDGGWVRSTSSTVIGVTPFSITGSEANHVFTWIGSTDSIINLPNITPLDTDYAIAISNQATRKKKSITIQLHGANTINGENSLSIERGQIFIIEKDTDSNYNAYRFNEEAERNFAISDFVKNALVEPPVAVYPLASLLDVNKAIVVHPFKTGTEPFNYAVTSGALPNGMSLDGEGNVAGTPDTVGTGTVTITSTNPAGNYDYVLNWEVTAPLGVDEYFNTQDKYPAFRSMESDFSDINFNKVEGLLGSINSSYVFDDTDNSQVYVHAYPVGAYLYAYLMQHSSSSYWYAFKSNTPPEGITDGLDLADGLSSSGYELVASDSDQITVDGIKYPVDDKVHWLTLQNYLNLGRDASLDGFMSSNNSWSYGFIVEDDIPEDFLGRPMFSVDDSNFFGFKRYNTTYSYYFYGRSADTISYSGEDSYQGLIPSGTHIIVTYNGSSLKMYVGGTLRETSSVSFYWDSNVLTDLRDIHFGKSLLSNTDVSSPYTSQLSQGYWQGKIKDLWISNGVTFNSTQVSSISEESSVESASEYGLITHLWRLNETSGSTFSSAKGSVTINGDKDA